MAKGASRGQKLALKRQRREKKVQANKARKRALLEGSGSRSEIAAARTWPIEECVISRGWRERGLAHIIVTRRAPDGSFMVGAYYVDIFCVGLMESAVIRDVQPEDYAKNVRSTIFKDEVELEPCDPGMARAIVEGAISFAAGYGFRPNKRWDESKKVLDDVAPKEKGLVFGRDGRPCLVKRKDRNYRGILARLERKVGSGNYLVVEADVAEGG